LINDLGSWTLTSTDVDPWTEATSLSLEETFALVHRSGGYPFFRNSVVQDYYHARYYRMMVGWHAARITKMMFYYFIQLDQGDRLLPYQEYYSDSYFPRQRIRLQDTIIKLAELLDGSNATDMAIQMIDLEKKIGDVSSDS
jgi:hypothetical protein